MSNSAESTQPTQIAAVLAFENQLRNRVTSDNENSIVQAIDAVSSIALVDADSPTKMEVLRVLGNVHDMKPDRGNANPVRVAKLASLHNAAAIALTSDDEVVRTAAINSIERALLAPDTWGNVHAEVVKWITVTTLESTDRVKLRGIDALQHYIDKPNVYNGQGGTNTKFDNVISSAHKFIPVIGVKPQPTAGN